MGKVNQPGISPLAEMVITPGGPRLKSNVHLIESGYHVQTIKGTLHKVHTATGQSIQLLGKMNLRTNSRKSLRNLSAKETSGPKSGGWIVYSGWMNAAGSPINYFSTDWIVPPPPSTKNGQLIYLFNGIEDANYQVILQPVLQWGVSPAGGGNYWAIANWYVGGPGSGLGLHSSLVPVNPGDRLKGIMTLTGQSGNAFDYQSAFEGYSNDLSVRAVGELVWANETLECYNLKAFTDYPAAGFIQLNNIELQTGGAQANLAWTPYAPVQDNGQRCDVISNNSPGGEVDLYY